MIADAKLEKRLTLEQTRKSQVGGGIAALPELLDMLAVVFRVTRRFSTVAQWRFSWSGAARGVTCPCPLYWGLIDGGIVFSFRNFKKNKKIKILI